MILKYDSRSDRQNVEQGFNLVEATIKCWAGQCLGRVREGE